MANNRYVNTNFWKDNYVADLDPIEKLVFIYLLTNPRTNMAGVYEVNIREIAFDTGIDKDMIVKIMSRFESDNKIIVDNGWVAILNFQKHQSLNPKTRVAAKHILDVIPTTLSTKLASSSTFLASSSTLLLSQQFEDQNIGNNSSEPEQKSLLVEPMDSLLHRNTIGIGTIYKEVGTNVPTGPGPENEIVKRLPSAEISEMFAQWEIAIGYKIESRIKQNRFACSNLLKKYGRDGVLKLISGVAAAKTDQYAPRIADFSALQSKYNELISWGHARNNKVKIGVVQ